MKKLFLFISFVSTFALFPNGRAFSQTTEVQKVKTERTVGNFNAVNAKNGINLVLQNKSADNVVVEANDNISKGIELKLLNGILNISTKKCVVNDTSVGCPKVYVPAKGIRRITVSGGSDVFHDETIEADILYLTVTGSSDMILDINAREVFLTVSGSADVRLTGRTQMLKVSSSGSCDVDCKALFAENVIVGSSGSSDVYVNAMKTIEVKASGASDVYYKGDPEFKRMGVYGSAEVHRR